tara:strand:+ start:1042 stop:1464 length:423 start_codon:yes stop_codon:yes gene_type:complete
MITRQTSIDCFNQIKKEGLLSKMRFHVYESIFLKSKQTAGELSEFLNLTGIKIRHGSVNGRLTELRDLGVIYEKDVRACKVTGRNVIEWDLTDRLPITVKNTKKTKKQRVNDALDSLRQLYKNNSTDEDWKNVADLIKNI